MFKFISRSTYTLSLIFITNFAFSQADTTKDPWEFTGLSSLNFTQVALSNWNGGGTSALSANGIGTYSANYTKDKEKWSNTLNIAYGIQRTEETGTRKTDDKLEFVSKYNRTAFKKWSYTSILNFRSQLQPGYSFPEDAEKIRISDWMAPGYLNFSIGLENQPYKWLTIYISPISSKTTFVLDDELSAVGAFGVDANETVRYEFGGLVKLAVDAKLDNNIKYTSSLELFSNYSNNPENIDVNWDNLIAFQINKFLTTSLSFTLIYDDDIKLPIDSNDDGETDYSAPRTQIKQVLSIGVQYKF